MSSSGSMNGKGQKVHFREDSYGGSSGYSSLSSNRGGGARPKLIMAAVCLAFLPIQLLCHKQHPHHCLLPLSLPPFFFFLSSSSPSSSCSASLFSLSHSFSLSLSFDLKLKWNVMKNSHDQWQLTSNIQTALLQVKWEHLQSVFLCCNPGQLKCGWWEKVFHTWHDYNYHRAVSLRARISDHVSVPPGL